MLHSPRRWWMWLLLLFLRGLHPRQCLGRGGLCCHWGGRCQGGIGFGRIGVSLGAMGGWRHCRGAGGLGIVV